MTKYLVLGVALLASTSASATVTQHPLITLVFAGTGPDPVSTFDPEDDTPTYFTTSSSTNLNVSIPTINHENQAPTAVFVSAELFNYYSITEIPAYDAGNPIFVDQAGNLFSYTISDHQSGASISASVQEYYTPLPSEFSCLFDTNCYDSRVSVNVLSFDPAFLSETNPALDFSATSVSTLETPTGGNLGTISEYSPDIFADDAFATSALSLTYSFYEKYRPAETVPEPAVWALMLTGFGLAGTAVRRDRGRRERQRHAIA